MWFILSQLLKKDAVDTHKKNGFFLVVEPLDLSVSDIFRGFFVHLFIWFLVVHGVQPPPPLSSPTTTKTTCFWCVSSFLYILNSLLEFRTRKEHRPQEHSLQRKYLYCKKDHSVFPLYLSQSTHLAGGTIFRKHTYRKIFQVHQWKCNAMDLN